MNVRESFAATADVYDRSRRQLVPCFDDFYRMAVEQADFPRDSVLRVLDLGAGTGLVSAFFADAFPSARFVLVDVATEMLAKARGRFNGDPRFEYREMDFAAAPLPSPFDLVISALAIHHLSDDGKADLFRRIYGALRYSGIFVNADEVLARTAAVERRNWDAWHREARALGATEDDIAAAVERMTHDRTSRLDDQLRWIEDAGFRDVDCAYKYNSFAVMSGRK